MMKMNSFTAVLGSIILAGACGNSQHSSEKPILPAPSATGRAIARNGQTTAEPHLNTNKVVGGVPSPGRPFMAALLYEKNEKLYQYCGASVIGDRWLLTAAHCDVKEGEWAVINRPSLQAKGGVVLAVAHVYTYQQYNSDNHDNDISLLKLSGDISAAIPRVRIAAPPAARTDVLTAGWGVTEDGKQSLNLLEVKVPIIDSTSCKASYNTLTDNMICAGEPGKDSCQGDSGGPLFLEAGDHVEQVGIVSYGRGCGLKGFPGVYTRVDHYQNWITTTMNQ